LNTALVWGVFSVIFIDLILAADNALLIASAVRDLSSKTQRQARWLGTIGAVIARLFFLGALFFVLRWPVLSIILHIIGGLWVIWAAIKLLPSHGKTERGHKTPKEKLWHATWFIISADIAMSFDNVIAVYAVSGGNILLIVLGILVSVPMVIFASSRISSLMTRFPTVVIFGSVYLGWVGGRMITESHVLEILPPILLPILGASLVFTVWAVGKYFRKQ